ncbi:hypothetical protein [Streptomyces achromogenes]|uniref:hypothetical protein n=1 Tax=Streptomyces achromogenes TaxID=67255 RepID=UPI00340A1724
MTDRRPLCTGPATADASRTRNTDPSAPRASLTAERLSVDPADAGATRPKPRPTAGRCTLGAGPTTPGQ